MSAALDHSTTSARFYMNYIVKNHSDRILLARLYIYIPIYIYIYIYIYITSEKPVNDQFYGVLDRYGITILYK